MAYQLVFYLAISRPLFHPNQLLLPTVPVSLACNWGLRDTDLLRSDEF